MFFSVLSFKNIAHILAILSFFYFVCVKEDISTVQTQLSEVRSNQKDQQRDLDLMQSTQHRSVKFLNIILQFMLQYIKH